MNTEKDNKTAFLDTSGKRKPDRHLTTSVNREPTHTDQYLAYDSDHLESVKHGNVRCLFDRAKRLVTKSSVISEDKKHLSSVLVSNGYPSAFKQKVTKTRNCSLSREHVTQFKSTAVLPYVKGVSEPLRRCLTQQGVSADLFWKQLSFEELIYAKINFFVRKDYSNCSLTWVINHKANILTWDFMES